MGAACSWIVVGGANQKNWQRIADALGASQLMNDPRFATAGSRVQHLNELEAELTPRFRQQPSEHWLAALDKQGVPCGPVRDMLQALSDPQTVAREMVVEVPHTTLGTVQTLGVPVKFSCTPARISHGAPVYGEHSREVLRDHGFSADEIAGLERDRAVVSAAPRPEGNN